MRANRSTLTVVPIILAMCIAAGPAAAQNIYPATVKDISDRAYRQAVVELLDGAKESIVVSMYTISLSSQGHNPISMLLGDLIEARHRGVAVKIYLNTRFKAGRDVRSSLEADPALKQLRDAGCDIVLVPSNKRLHDKLIIVDGRYVVEGSTNWSLSALMDNYESATLIDSPQLAQSKLTRLAALEADDRQGGSATPDRTGLDTGDPAGEMALSDGLLTDKRYLPRMVTRDDKRAMDAYLILAAVMGQAPEGVFIDLESLGVSMGMPAEWDDTAIRRQVIRALKDLEDGYGLVKARYFHGKDAYVTLVDVPGGRMAISRALAKVGAEPARVKFMRIVAAYLKARGEDMAAMTDDALAKRFGVSHWTIQETRKVDVLKRYTL